MNVLEPVDQLDTESARPRKRQYVAPNERQRAVRACDECRRLKEKCQGGFPCRRCRHLRRPCEVSAPAAAVDKRGPPLPDSQQQELVERSRCMEAILKHHFPDLALDIDSLRRTCRSLSLPSSPLPVSQLPQAEIDGAQRSESPGMEPSDCTVDYVDGTVAHYSGEFSHWNFSMHVKRTIDHEIVKRNEPALEHTSPTSNFIRVGEAHPDSTSISDILAILPPRPVAEFLTNVFFKHATSVYYYVDRRWLNGMMGRMYTDANQLRSKDVTAACAVVMVLAVGTQYVHLESPDRHSVQNDSGSRSSNNHNGWELDIGSAFYREVAKLLSEVIHSGSLLSVQVCLLLSLYCLPIDASGLGYIYLNLAVKLAIQNGTHRKVSRDAFDSATIESRRRVWWTAYCMERKIAIYHGRPTAVLRSDIDADLPLIRQEYTDIDDTYDSSYLLYSIKLTFQAEAFLREISLLRKCQRQEVGAILDRIKRLKADLKTLAHSRSGTASFTRGPNTAEPTTQRAEMHVQLECCLLEMFIGRPFILVHRQASRSGRATKQRETETTRLPRRSASSEDCDPRATRSSAQFEFIVRDCVSAAKEAIEICHTMQVGSMGLARSSYIEYSSCRASLLVLIAYSIHYRTNNFSLTLKSGLDAIREMASAGESARSEVSLIETLEAALHRLHVFDEASDHASTAASDSGQDGYEGFMNWYMQHMNARKEPAANPRDGADGSAARVWEPEAQPGSSMRANDHYVAAYDARRDMTMDSGMLDFDSFTAAEHMAFFTPDFDEHGIQERALLENLLDMPSWG